MKLEVIVSWPVGNKLIEHEVGKSSPVRSTQEQGFDIIVQSKILVMDIN